MRSMVLAALACAALGAHTGVQAANDADAATPCDNVETDQQSFECSAYNRKTAERELGEAYKDLEDRINSQYADHPTQMDDFLAKIKTAQELWVRLRDADCALDTFNAAKGSQAYEVAHNDCIAQQSDERSEYLQSVGVE